MMTATPQNTTYVDALTATERARKEIKTRIAVGDVTPGDYLRLWALRIEAEYLTLQGQFEASLVRGYRYAIQESAELIKFEIMHARAIKLADHYILKCQSDAAEMRLEISSNLQSMRQHFIENYSVSTWSGIFNNQIEGIEREAVRELIQANGRYSLQNLLNDLDETYHLSATAVV